ncbi:hypothetical protein QYM36_004443 [Artemia franciscana]|uniref:Reverse transcriptase domain-containing protein n=1 Tax=Artemia franciscana TaxID=6661 RepID=A0AA88I5H5_ARTSF|nr:hypothetical protein QYM36_004443 [Artemia franciscana]
MFADDLLTCHKSPSIEEASKSAQITLEEIQEYSKDHGVPLSTKKTKVIVIHRKRNTLANPEIRISGRTLKVTTSAKILGVHFDKRSKQMNYLDYLEVYTGGLLRERKTDAGIFIPDFNLKLLLRLSDGSSYQQN